MAESSALDATLREEREAAARALKLREHVTAKVFALLQHENQSKNVETSIMNSSIAFCRERRLCSNNAHVWQPIWSNRFFVSVYKHRALTVINNLKHHGLADRIRTKQIKTRDVGFMTRNEVCPDAWHISIESTNDAPILPEDYRGLVQCKKCRSFRTTYTELQTRASDEAMTIFILCADCGNRFKM